MFSKVMSERISAILARIVSVLLVGFILASCVWEGFPADTVRENITFDEAQDLVDFPICLPTYISEGVEPTPNIIFEADSANVPEETYIRLRYNRQDTQEKIIEVFQRYTNSLEMESEYPASRLDDMQQRAMVSLIDWIFSNSISTTQLRKIRTQTRIEAKVHQTDHTISWLYEIVEPDKYRSTMTKWNRNHVEYRVMSFLSADEIIKITDTLIECSSR
jgi:hypothetical protein